VRAVTALALLLAACTGGTTAVEGEMAAATFVAAMDASDLESVGRDRQSAAAGAEDRLDVLRPPASAEIVQIYPSSPIPDPFEFVRNPLSAGGVTAFLESADRIVAVLHPLIDTTPGGRVLAGSLVGLGADGTVVGTDWDDEGDAAVAALVAWGAGRGHDPLTVIELAVRGLGGSDDADAITAADFVRG
jgi:hypothetical protein